MDANISNILLQRPVTFTIGDNRYSIYPATLGCMQLSAVLLQDFDTDEGVARAGNDLELMRIFHNYNDHCYRLIAYRMLKGKEVIDEQKVRKVIRVLKALDNEDVLLLLKVVLEQTDMASLMKGLGITAELDEMRRVVAMKKDEGASLQYCGVSIYGGTINTLAEKYGWTLDYILWGISYDNIQLLLADAPKTIFLSEEERKRIKTTRGKDVMKVDDPANYEALKHLEFD